MLLILPHPNSLSILIEIPRRRPHSVLDRSLWGLDETGWWEVTQGVLYFGCVTKNTLFRDIIACHDGVGDQYGTELYFSCETCGKKHRYEVHMYGKSVRIDRLSPVLHRCRSVLQLSRWHRLDERKRASNGYYGDTKT